MTSAASPPLKISASLSLWILSSLAICSLLATKGRRMGKCLFNAGPKLSEAFTKLSMAEQQSYLFLDLRHLSKSIVFYFTIIATIVLSSTMSLGSNNTLCQERLYSTMLFYDTDILSSSRTRPAAFSAKQKSFYDYLAEYKLVVDLAVEARILDD